MSTATAAPPSPRPESSWWLVVAGALVVHVLAYLAFLGLFAAFWFAVLFGFAFDAPFPALLFPAGGFVLVLGVGLLVLLLGVALPVAIYFDAEAIRDATDEWDPDPVLYGLAALVGLFTHGIPLQPAVAAYYLYKRHEHLGTP